RDLLGIAAAIVGAITVVIASKSSDVRLGPKELIEAITRPSFAIYACVVVTVMVILMVLSEQPIGHEFVYIDVGLCALFGGFTVLSTKGFSTLLSLEGLNIFQEWITYPLIIVLLGTGVGQVRYLNRALMSFDSKIVVPTQFVLFTLAAIVGSAILYRDFDNISFYRFIVFLYGVATTFAGVLILTRPDIQLTPEPSAEVDASQFSTPTMNNVALPTTYTPLRTIRVPPGTPVDLRYHCPGRGRAANREGTRNGRHLAEKPRDPPHYGSDSWDEGGRLFSSISDAQDSGDGAKRVLLSSCNSAQTAATVAASLPRYMAEGTNEGIEKAVNNAVDAAKATMIFSLTALEGIIEFVIDIYRSTFLCFLELAVRGTLSVLIGATQEFSNFVTNSLNSLRTSIQGDIASANNVIQSAVSAVNNLIPSFLNVQLSVPTFDIPSLSGLQDVTLPTTIQDSLTQLNSSIPTLDELRQGLDNLIETPFNALKQELNNSFSQIRFDKSVLPVPATQQLTFCNDLDTSVVDDLIRDLIKIARIGCFLLLGVAILMIIGNCFVQWYRWKSLKHTLDRVREEETTTITGAGPMMELSDRNLLSVASSIENPFAARVAYLMTRIFRLSPQKNINLRFFFNYIFYAPALACFLIGFFGLISVQLQLIAIQPIQRHYSAQVATQVNNFAQSIADGVNGDMLAQSTAYANSVNTQIDTLQTSVNQGVFGWVNGTIVPLNNTIEAFYQDIQNAVQTVFGGTILETPMQEFIRCLIGTKVEALENAFTFVQENFQVNVPRVEPTVLMLSNSTVQEATTPIALAAVGGENGGDDGGIVGNLVNRYVAALEKERLMFLIFLGLWMIVVFMAIGIIFWHSYAKTWVYRYKKNRFNQGRKNLVAGESVITPWVDDPTRRAGGKESPFKPDEKGLIDWAPPLLDSKTPSNETTTTSGLPKSYLVSEPVTTYSNIARPAKAPKDLRTVIRLDSPTPSSTHQRNDSASSQGSTEGLLRKKSGRKLTANGRRPIRETLITDGLDNRGVNTGLSPNGASNEDDSPSRTSDGGFLTKLGGIFGPTSAIESDEQEHASRPPLPTMGTFGQNPSPVDNGVAPQPQRVQLMEGEKRKSVHAKQGGARTPTSQVPPPPGLGKANPFWSPNAPQSVSGTSFLSSSADSDSPINNRQSNIPIHHGFLYDSRMRVPAVPQMPKPLSQQPGQNGGAPASRNPSQSHNRSLSGGPRQLFPGGPQHSRKSSLIDPALANIAGVGTQSNRQLETIPGTPNMGQQQANPFTSPYDDRRTSRAQRASNPFADRYPSVY
ncbi:plasma membrane fusion protein prm1, partial [Tulasnella sp. 417]